LAEARARAWVPVKPVRTLKAAVRYLAAVHFAALFPARDVAVPSLWEAVGGRDADPDFDLKEMGFGPEAQLIWGWKDQIPLSGGAWYGKFVFKRASFLSPTLLAALYRGGGDIDDHLAFELSPAAHEIAAALVLSGAMTTAALREVVGDKARYDKAMTELQRNLLVTAAGTQEQRAGWPHSTIDLTCRLFDVGDRHDPRRAAELFATTMIEASPRELARAFGWSVTDAARLLRDERVPGESGSATASGVGSASPRPKRGGAAAQRRPVRAS
jgi:hypothetical protein